MLLELSMLLMLGVPLQIAADPGAVSMTVDADAQRLEAEGRFSDARDIYERNLLVHPKDSEALKGIVSASERLSLSERSAGHMDLALTALLRALTDAPDEKRIMLDVGILEDEMMLYLDAAKVLEHLETLSPVDPNAFYALARTDLNLGRLDVAQQQMELYMKVRPEDASAHFGLGRILLAGQKFDEAEGEFKRSVELQPKQSEAYYQLGQVSLDRNRLEDSIVQFQRTLDRNPQHGGALAGMGTAYFKLKQYDKSREWLVKAIQAAPEYLPGHYYLGLTLARLGDEPGSRHEFEIATELAAKDSKQSATRMRILSPASQP